MTETVRTRTAPALAMALLAVLVAGIATVVTLAVTDDDNWSGHRGAMMSTGNSAGAGAMPGMHGMHGTRVTSEYAYLAEMVAHHEEAVMAARELQRSERPRCGRSVSRSSSHRPRRSTRWRGGWPSGTRTVPDGWTTDR